MPRRSRSTLCIDDYDCIGFDLDHTLCRYHVDNLFKLVYKLLSEYLVEKKGYDPDICKNPLENDIHLIAKGLTLDCERGNILRISNDGYILAATHGTRKMPDQDIERMYGRDRRRHPVTDYIHHLKEFGPQKLVDFSPLLHCFMDYFDLAAPLLCARIVDVLDDINNNGKAMKEYYFWPDVHEGLRELYLRTHFAADQGGFFPALKANPELYILKRSPEFRHWLKMLRDNGKFLYVITGSHYDFASHVASYAIGEDWKDLFDIVIFFARKPSFFVEKRPFWRLNGAQEVESFKGWEDLETGECYSQGNWQDLNEFFEYCTEWEPANSLYFGDNIVQDILGPKKFTTTIDSVAVSEEMMAEGMLGIEPSHPHKDLLTSCLWGSYFYHPRQSCNQSSRVFNAFRKMSASVTNGLSSSSSSGQTANGRRSASLERVASMKATIRNYTATDKKDISRPIQGREEDSKTVAVSASSSGVLKCGHPEDESVVGPPKINTLWGSLIRDHARMCIPDLEVLLDYPIDYCFPSFANPRGSSSSKSGDTNSGFFPADPISLHRTSKR